MVANVLSSSERQLRYLIGAVIVAAASSVALVFLGSDPIDLEAVVPWGPDPTVGAQGQGLAIGILVALPLIAALPLIFRGVWRLRVAVFASVMVSVFVLVSLIRVGILYVPSRVDAGPCCPDRDWQSNRRHAERPIWAITHISPSARERHLGAHRNSAGWWTLGVVGEPVTASTPAARRHQNEWSAAGDPRHPLGRSTGPSSLVARCRRSGVFRRWSMTTRSRFPDGS